MSDATTSTPRRGARGALRTMRLAVRLVAEAAPRELLLTVVLTVVGGLLTAAELLVGRRLVELLVAADAGTRSRSVSVSRVSDLVPMLIALGFLMVGTSLVSVSVGELRTLLNELVYRRAVGQLLEAATAAELELFDDPDFHDDIERARENADQYAWQVVWGMVTLLTTTITVVAVGAVLLSVAPLLVPVAFVAYIPIAIVSVTNTKALYKMHYGLAELDRDRAYHERLLTGRLEAKEVRAFGLTQWLRNRHDELFAERVRQTRRVVVRRTGLALIGSSITSLMLVLALGAVAAFAINGRLSVSDAAIAVVGLRQLSARLAGVGAASTSVLEGVTFLRNFAEFRERAPAPLAIVDALAVPDWPQRITVDGVSYTYPAGEHPVLNDVHLTLRPGEVVAIVGPNGSGKSTLAKLLCGLLPPSQGSIRWDDTDIARCRPDEVRRRVAPVFQDFTRYEHTAAETIGFGDVARLHDRQAIENAAKAGGVDEFITALPAGYETRLSTAFAGGTDLSGGQWQRVAIARAFFRDAPLVVMDEPAAALDPRAERDLFDRLHVLGHNRMVLFISHRFATVRRADHIVLLLGGRVAEAGNHEELMALGGVYAELYSLQADQFG